MSFEDAALQAIASGSSGSPTSATTPVRFDILQLSVEVGGFVGRPQFIVNLAREAGPNV